MRSSKAMVRQTVSKDINQPRCVDEAAGATGRKAGEEVEVSPDIIRVRAYEIYRARNGEPGDEVSDWCEAEAEINGGPTSDPAREGCDGDPATLGIKTRADAQRPPATSVRRGLSHAAS